MKNKKENLNALNNALYQAADELYKQGKIKEALEEFKKALKAWPTDSDSAWAIADCYSEMGKPEEAEDYYKKALKYCPEDKRADLTYNIGNALFDQRRFKEAILIYETIPKEHQAYKLAKRSIGAAKRSIKRI